MQLRSMTRLGINFGKGRWCNIFNVDILNLLYIALFQLTRSLGISERTPRPRNDDTGWHKFLSVHV